MDTKELIVKLKRLAPLARRRREHTADLTWAEQEDNSAWWRLSLELQPELGRIIQAMIEADLLRVAISDNAERLTGGRPERVVEIGTPDLGVICDPMPPPGSLGHESRNA